MKRFKNILFLADRKEGLNSTLERLVGLSKSNDARLTIMDVVSDAGLERIINRAYSIDLNEKIREQRQEELEQTIQHYAETGVPIYLKVVTGIPFIEVIRAVQRNQYDLVVKVAQHKKGFASSLFGSTDMHLLRKCPCPVWIDSANNDNVYTRILAAVEPFDDESTGIPKLILDLATSMADREHAKLDIVHVWNLPGESMFESGFARISPKELDQLLENTEQQHYQALDSLLSQYNLSANDSNVHLIKGKPSNMINLIADELDIDLIVMGTLGRVGMPGLFIGNTAEDVLVERKTAVLAVKPHGFVSPVR
jgi:nucleotide-binding universal stress UspA family protein